MWSSSEYAYHLVTSLPELKVLDQQEIADDVRASAAKWKQSSQAGSSAQGKRIHTSKESLMAIQFLI